MVANADDLPPYILTNDSCFVPVLNAHSSSLHLRMLHTTALYTAPVKMSSHSESSKLLSIQVEGSMSTSQ